MSQYQKVLLLLARLSLGWLFLYSGITKIMSGNFSAAGYLGTASNFTGFYHWLTNPQIIPLVNFANEWGQLLLGISLILGLFMRWSTILGALLMVLYYFVLPFPRPNAHSFIVDEHIVYAITLLLLGALQAGKYFGLGARSSRLA